MKHRVWCKGLDEWETDSTFVDSTGTLLFFDHRRGMTEANMKHHVLEYSTGVKDKNGKEIFEGDIMAVPAHLKDEYRKCVVELIDGVFAIEKNSTSEQFLEDDTMKIIPELFEIIGNIHQ